MQEELRRCIAATQQILRELGPPTTLCVVAPQPSKDLLAAVASSGLPFIRDSRLPSKLASELHLAAQTHFQSACLALEATHSRSSFATLQSLALQLKTTFNKLYERKIAAAVTARRTGKYGEKQPFANDILLYAFEQSQSPTKRERQVLASVTGLSREQVRVWFQNRRQRMKKRAPDLQPRRVLNLEELLACVAASKPKEDLEEEFDDNDSGYYSSPDCDSSTRSVSTNMPATLTAPVRGPRSYPAIYTRGDLSTEFQCEPPSFIRRAATHPPVYVDAVNIADLTRSMARLTLRHRRQSPRSTTSSKVLIASAPKATIKSGNAATTSSKCSSSTSDAPTRKKAVRKDPETGRKFAGRRTASASSRASSDMSSPSSSSPASSSASSPAADSAISSIATDASAKPRKRAGPLRRKPAGQALARQASSSSVASTSTSGSSRSTSYSSDFSQASDSSFTSVESVPTAANMDCFQPQQQFDPLAAFDFTQLFSSQPSDILPQPVADFELPPDLLAGLQMPMDTAAFPPPESTDFLALLNDPTIQDLLQSVQDMDVVAPQQVQDSLTFNNTFDVGSVDSSAFLDLSASTLPTFDAMFGLDASSFQDSLWNSPGFSLPITA